MRDAIAGHPIEVAHYLGVQLGGSPQLAFDFTTWGNPFAFTGLAFSVVNNTAGVVTQRAAVSPDGANEVSQGFVPASLDVPAGQTSWDQFGVDLFPPWWRLWLTGTGSCDVHVFAMPRSAMRLPELA